MIELMKGNCLIESDKIESGSVDLILTDLPYGNMNTDGGRKLGINGWDFAIEPEKVYEIATRILRKNGKMILFSQEPYTTKLITEAIPNIPFNYRATWEKDNFAVALGARVNMVSFTEDILVFSKGDCLIESDKIESGSVDLILTDLPYGNMNTDGGRKLGINGWDLAIDPKKVYEIANRILRKNGKMVLTANQPFTTELISKAIPNVPHCYNMYWDKMHFANCLIANKAPVSYIEDILIFSKNCGLVIRLWNQNKL